MTSWAEEVLAMAKKLPREDQLRIAEALQKEATPLPAAQVEAAWNDEIVQRVEALERGEVEFVDAKEVFARIRAKHAR
jgi:hypothetical protein